MNLLSELNYEDKLKIIICCFVFAQLCLFLIALQQRKIGNIMRKIQLEKGIKPKEIPSTIWRKRARDDYFIYIDFLENGLDVKYPELAVSYKRYERLVLVVQFGLLISFVVIPFI